jgi:hypothetical protein
MFKAKKKERKKERKRNIAHLHAIYLHVIQIAITWKKVNI